ncbi:MAG TPA: glycosyltransferase [Pirellulales bacterium]|nr:glycosyltransferase [Pirellulales bacterium]
MPAGSIFFSLILVIGLALHLLGVVLAARWMRRQRHAQARQVNDPSYRPGVTILKPLCGVDDNLERNLESFAALEYPRFQIVLGAADAADPALTVARRVFARHPEIDAEFVVVPGAVCGNPKVQNLDALYAHARYEFCLISDSNVVVRPNEIEHLVAPFRDPRVGLVYQPVVGVGEETVPAALENYKLTDLSGYLMVFVNALTGWDVVMGKGMMFRGTALDAVGGFDRVRQVAAEDYVLGLALRGAGWRLEMSSLPVRGVQTRWSWHALANRTFRHAAMRCRLSPWSYPIELLGNPVCVALMAVLCMGASWLPVLAATVLVKMLVDLVNITTMRGSRPRLAHLPLLTLKDLIAGMMWLPAIFGHTVTWRGNVMRLGWGTRLSPVAPAAPRRAVAPAATPLGGPHIPLRRPGLVPLRDVGRATVDR